MDTKEFKQLTYSIVPALKEHFAVSKDGVEVRVLQDTLNQQGNPFQPAALLIGVGYRGTRLMEVYQVTNDGESCAWEFRGQANV